MTLRNVRRIGHYTTRFAVVVLLACCSANEILNAESGRLSRAERDAQAIRALTDTQLLQEIQAAETKLAQLGVSAQYLAATRPSPMYTLSGTSFATGTFWRYGSTGSFTYRGQAIYELRPNYGAEIGYAVAQAIVAVQANKALKRRGMLINEALERVERREAESRTSVENFYMVYPGLKGHEALVASVAPWVQKENPNLVVAELLNVLAARVETMLAGDHADLAGDWYGLVVEEITLPDGSKSPFWAPARARLVTESPRLAGVWELLDGQQGTLQLLPDEGTVTGTALNATYGLGFQVTGTAEGSRLSMDFSASGNGAQFVGRAVMVR